MIAIVGIALLSAMAVFYGVRAAFCRVEVDE